MPLSVQLWTRCAAAPPAAVCELEMDMSESLRAKKIRKQHFTRALQAWLVRCEAPGRATTQIHEVLLMDKILHDPKALRTLNYGNYGIFLIMGSAGFCPSTVVLLYVATRYVVRMSLEKSGAEAT